MVGISLMTHSGPDKGWHIGSAEGGYQVTDPDGRVYEEKFPTISAANEFKEDIIKQKNEQKCLP